MGFVALPLTFKTEEKYIDFCYCLWYVEYVCDTDSSCSNLFFLFFLEKMCLLCFGVKLET